MVLFVAIVLTLMFGPLLFLLAIESKVWRKVNPRRLLPDPRIKQWENRLRGEGSENPKEYAKICVERGIPIDFELPYPEPRNEHEDAMNWVHLNPVMSGRSDW